MAEVQWVLQTCCKPRRKSLRLTWQCPWSKWHTRCSFWHAPGLTFSKLPVPASVSCWIVLLNSARAGECTGLGDCTGLVSSLCFWSAHCARSLCLAQTERLLARRWPFCGRMKPSLQQPAKPLLSRPEAGLRLPMLQLCYSCCIAH